MPENLYAKVPLYEIAHARAGDKGDECLLMISPYKDSDLTWLRKELTSDKIATHFGTLPEQVKIIVIEELSAISIVISNQLSGGVTRSHRIDPHGKSLSSHLLDYMMHK